MLNKKTSREVNLMFGLAIAFFLIIIFIPAIYILKYANNFEIFSNVMALRAITHSFLIGLIVTIINIIFGIPLAWMIAKGKNKFVKWIDNLVDLSLVMPTAALGFSIYLYWGSNYGIGKLIGLEDGIISKGPLMIVFLHIVFTLPYMIRSVVSSIQQIETQVEEASQALGACPFTFFRTVALPLFRDGIINGSILSFTRSLSETGATMMVAGAFVSAPILIISLKDQGNLSDAAGISILLIISAILILLVAKMLLGKRKINLSWGMPKVEKTISKLAPIKNIILILFFVGIVFLPTILILFYSLNNFIIPDILLLSKSLVISLLLAFLVTIINLLFSLPFSYMVARNRYRLGHLFDTLSEIVLLVPTSALGLSLALFWRRFIPSDMIILLLAHLSFSFPLLVKPLISAFKDISPSQEEVAYSLGAGVKRTFTTILLPQIKPAIIAGCIMAFMRSLSETGATLAVTKNIKTVTILIVELFREDNLSAAAFACSILFAIAFIFLYLLKQNQKA